MEKAAEEISALGERYREKVLLPFCKKYQLTFVSGNGDFAFYDIDTGLPVKTKLQAEMVKPILIPIFDVLNIEVSYNNYFGYYIYRIDESDLK